MSIAVTSALAAAGFTGIETVVEPSEGYDGTPCGILHILADHP